SRFLTIAGPGSSGLRSWRANPSLTSWWAQIHTTSSGSRVAATTSTMIPVGVVTTPVMGSLWTSTFMSHRPLQGFGQELLDLLQAVPDHLLISFLLFHPPPSGGHQPQCLLDLVLRREGDQVERSQESHHFLTSSPGFHSVPDPQRPRLISVSIGTVSRIFSFLSSFGSFMAL